MPRFLLSLRGKARWVSFRVQLVTDAKDLWTIVIFLIHGFSHLFGLNLLHSYDEKLTANIVRKKFYSYQRETSYSFNGIYLPFLPNSSLLDFYLCVIDTLGIYLYHRDIYSEEVMQSHERISREGPYCLIDETGWGGIY